MSNVFDLLQLNLLDLDIVFMNCLFALIDDRLHFDPFFTVFDDQPVGSLRRRLCGADAGITSNLPSLTYSAFHGGKCVIESTNHVLLGVLRLIIHVFEDIKRSLERYGHIFLRELNLIVHVFKRIKRSLERYRHMFLREFNLIAHVFERIRSLLERHRHVLLGIFYLIVDIFESRRSSLERRNEFLSGLLEICSSLAHHLFRDSPGFRGSFGSSSSSYGHPALLHTFFKL